MASLIFGTLNFWTSLYGGNSSLLELPHALF
jgi:hypothetical protein